MYEHPQRNQQFENIEQLKESYQQVGNPVLSMDTKKRINWELVSGRKNVHNRGIASI